MTEEDEKQYWSMVTKFTRDGFSYGESHRRADLLMRAEWKERDTQQLPTSP